MISEISYIKATSTLPCENLALEEYLTFHTREEECILYLWQNAYTVVIGKNQNCWKECKVKELTEDGGHLVRRMSGGGAVFHDLGNLNFTFCVRKENYDVDRQLGVIIEAVRMLGLNAKKTGRNDVTIDGRKFSGNAFFEAGEYCYHHGTILVDVDKQQMGRYLNVSKEKLASKGVESVKARVVNLKELCPDVTIPLMEEMLQKAFEAVYGQKVQPVLEERLDAGEIAENREKFASWDWIYGRKIPFQHEIEKRFSWGNIQLQLQVNGGKITDALLFSDAMQQEVVARISEILLGVNYDEQTMTEVMMTAGESEIPKEMAEDICRLIREQI